MRGTDPYTNGEILLELLTRWEDMASSLRSLAQLVQP